MNILFLTLCNILDIKSSGIYEDLIREFSKHQNNVFVVSPIERRFNGCTKLFIDENVKLLKVKTGNIQKTNVFEKGISTLLIESQFIKAIKKYFSDVKFDLVVYSTPPITIDGVVKYVKERDGAKTYLLLKDIFPQNAVDLGLMSKSGIKGLLFKYFRNKEKLLYSVSDRIGCMSQANVDYILKHNSDINSEKVEICPNCIEIQDFRLSEQERSKMRKKYGIPEDKRVFVYSGNLGKPQNISFVVNCLKACEKNENVFFVIAGSGTEQHILEKYIKNEQPKYVKFLGQISKDECDKMIACCDVGLIFLDYRFTIPNFPSRILSYMQAGLPVLACTDKNTDIGKVIVDGGFGWWCESNDVRNFYDVVNYIEYEYIKPAGIASLYNLKSNYTIQQAYRIITNIDLIRNANEHIMSNGSVSKRI